MLGICKAVYSSTRQLSKAGVLRLMVIIWILMWNFCHHMPFVFRPPGTAANAGTPKASGGRSPSYSPVSQRGAHDTNAPGTIMMLAIMMLARPLRCRCYTCRSRAHEENHTELYMLVMSMGAAGTSSSYVICAGLSGHL